MGQRLVTPALTPSRPALTYRVGCDACPELQGIKAAHEEGTAVKIVVDCKHGSTEQIDRLLDSLQSLVGAHKLVLEC